ncbi:probable E3 ubiquitin ligase complex SCF subunit sconB [Patiria miniata]|uniref:F-box domain-containing protein n=1 Tax=Patiria miniata TaxID=46514 RepID=A0A914ART9_PATMI|nr:probable E3 ubiquitin ligase complex SCF subunit sconB [Patiria miniata]
MENTEVTSNNSQFTTPTPPRVCLPRLPPELLELIILPHLTAADLCRMALCSREWRCVVNQDWQWRYFCRRKGWEHYCTVTDLSKEKPYRCSMATGSTCQAGEEHDKISFPIESIISKKNRLGLQATCKWKEIYMKARHLEKNWTEGRHHVSFFVGGYIYYRGLDFDRDCLVICQPQKRPRIDVWDLKEATLLHQVLVDVGPQSELKIKRGIIVVGCTDLVLRTFDAKTGQALQVMRSIFNTASRYYELFFDGEIVVGVKSLADVEVWNVLNGVCHFAFIVVLLGEHTPAVP